MKRFVSDYWEGIVGVLYIAAAVVIVANASSFQTAALVGMSTLFGAWLAMNFTRRHYEAFLRDLMKELV